MAKLKILFYLAKPYSVPTTASLRMLTRSNPNYSTLCFAPQRLLRLLEGERVTCDRREAAAFNPDIVFCPGNYVHDSIGGIKVQLFHGMCIEKPGHFRIRGFFQVYCTPGPLVTAEFLRRAGRHPSFEVVETGWPKTDLLFGNYLREPAWKACVPANRCVILYAPTFSRRYTSVPKLLPLLGELPRDDEFFIIKTHDLHDRRQVAELRQLPSERFLFVDDPDVTPCLNAADVLISDTSSVVYEFALRKTRIVLVDALRKDLPFIHCKSAEVRQAIDEARRGAGIDSAAVERLMKQMHPYRDGCSAQRVLEAVTDPTFIERVNRLPRRCNWFRRLKLRYYDWFKKGYVK